MGRKTPLQIQKYDETKTQHVLIGHYGLFQTELFNLAWGLIVPQLPLAGTAAQLNFDTEQIKGSSPLNKMGFNLLASEFRFEFQQENWRVKIFLIIKPNIEAK